MRSIILTGVAGLVLFVGCSHKAGPITFTDVQTRRGYRSVGEPTVQSNGAVNFVDATSGKSVTLQSWEATDDAGRNYTTQWDPLWARQKLVPSKAKKPDEPKGP